MVIVRRKTKERRRRRPHVMGAISFTWDDQGVLTETLLFTSSLKGPGESLSVCLGENPPRRRHSYKMFPRQKDVM